MIPIFNTSKEHYLKKKIRPHFYVFTGGPGSGKTTILEALRKKGFQIVEEVGRQIIQEQVSMDGMALPWRDKEKFRDLMLSRSIDTYTQVSEQEKSVFFDRGIPGLIGYSKLEGLKVSSHLEEAVQNFRYNQKIFVTPPWREIYQNDRERKQTYEVAVATYEAVTAAYLANGYEIVEIPRNSVEERVEFVLLHLSNN